MGRVRYWGRKEPIFPCLVARMNQKTGGASELTTSWHTFADLRCQSELICVHTVRWDMAKLRQKLKLAKFHNQDEKTTTVSRY